MTTPASTEHVGEWRVTLCGATLEALFEQAAHAVAVTAGGASGTAGPWERVAVEGRDAEALLVAWCNELIGRSEVERRVYADVDRLTLQHTGLDRWRLEADVRGTSQPRQLSPLKAATLHGLRLEHSETPDAAAVAPTDAERNDPTRAWRAELLFDV